MSSHNQSIRSKLLLTLGVLLVTVPGILSLAIAQSGHIVIWASLLTIFTGGLLFIHYAGPVLRDYADREYRYISIINHIPEAVITTNVTGKIIDYNTGAQNMFGWNASEVAGHKLDELLSYSNRLHNNQKLSSTKTANQAHEDEGLHRNGEVFPVEVSSCDTMHNGNTYKTSVIRDITERKQFENLQNQFISTITHELRTPVTAIQGALELYAKGNIGSEIERKNLITIARRNTRSMNTLINDLLDLRQLEASGFSLNSALVDVSNMISNAIENNSTYAQRFGIHIKRDDSSARFNAQVNGDEKRLQQVLSNLISNAVKASEPGQSVTLSCSIDAGNWVQIEIRDQGCGIPESFRPFLFNRFSQNPGSFKNSVAGSGLGLAIAKQLVQAHSGEIICESNKQGTIMKLRLPTIFPEQRHSHYST